jgi:hypothetical protein
MKANLKKNSMRDLGAEKAREIAEKCMTDNADNMRKGGMSGGIQTIATKYKNGGKSLLLLQVIC